MAHLGLQPGATGGVAYTAGLRARRGDGHRCGRPVADELRRDLARLYLRRSQIEYRRMTVLVDAGNSRIKWCELCGGELSQVCVSEYASPDRAQAVLTALDAAHAPRRRFHEPCIVVDCGTAVTIDALDAEGQHLGGLILPGLELMRRSLLEHTARISFGSDGDSDDQALFGRSTAQGVRVGARLALTASIDRIVADMGAYSIRLHGSVPVHNIMTGGAGMHMLGYLAARYEFEPKLVLQGLAIIADDSALQAPSRERKS